MFNNFLLKSIIITSVVIVVGILIISPVFFGNEKKLEVLITVEILPSENLYSWCKNLAEILNKNVSSAVFISGNLAEKHPSCITSFERNVEIGSQTYSYVNLTAINDYLDQLDEIQKGKNTIDEIGGFDSRIFKAPFLATDDNIFSLLGKNHIEFDLSYSDHYNKYYNDQFLKFELIPLDWKSIDGASINKINKEVPVLISFDSNVTTDEIAKVINQLKMNNAIFVNPSDLAGKNLVLYK